MAGTHEELALLAAGHRLVAGVDEVGRGCWAGPVVAAAVVFPPAMLADSRGLDGIEDSKTLGAAARSRLAGRIQQLALGVGVGAVPAHMIDLFGIAQAARLAMAQAILALPCLPDALLIDWVRLGDLPLPQRAFARADALSVSVAAASIVAKVRRDSLMAGWDRRDPRYAWAEHKGYGTAGHSRALREHGLSPLHRRSFKPIQALAAEQAG
ncbi:MAG TPA: ribonuclease HII [Herpetosiphonaceae bacterium]|nr:ribonuclease HII [Herpetosiphonaceae bacterium]